ncbi:hypothetical protein PR001_g143 [Phytophthora rubi]|uniref:Uncharacterized protein n=1 Tax=Phytophthora rubi TaxID=129364 RepID=A0A6A3PJH0_9STRA|nr:hypothetical protein PR001_g143 [Phytophthora rubi]
MSNLLYQSSIAVAATVLVGESHGMSSQKCVSSSFRTSTYLVGHTNHPSTSSPCAVLRYASAPTWAHSMVAE